MNPRIFVFVFMVMVLASSSAHAQQNKMEVGGAIKFDINSAESSGFGYDFTGINGRFYYYLNERFRLAPNINFNFPYKESDGGIEAKANLTTYNAQVHYLFNLFDSPALKPYVLGGLSYNHVKVEASGMGQTASESANDMSLSLGVGIDYQIKPGKLFFEIQELFGDYKPLVIGFGIMFDIN